MAKSPENVNKRQNLQNHIYKNDQILLSSLLQIHISFEYNPIAIWGITHSYVVTSLRLW